MVLPQPQVRVGSGRGRGILAVAMVLLLMLPKTAAAQGWFSDTVLGAQIEGGIMASSARSSKNTSFGQLIPGRSNQPTLDQLALTWIKPVDPIGGGYGLGVNLRFLYGSDARSYVITGISDRILTGRYQVMPVYANVALHMPWLTKGGLDGQVGVFAAPMGVEALDPSVRAFYTLAYTTEYSTPFEHVGGMFQWHLNTHFDLQFGMDTGNQTSFGRGDNNHEPAGYVGLSGSNLAGGPLSFTYLFRVGPEDAIRAIGPRANSAQRFWNDLNGTWKFSDRWSVSAELNQVHDQGLRADTWSGVVWAALNVSSVLTLNARTELYRDNTGQFVTQYLGNTSYAQTLLGHPADTLSAPATTYGDLSLNAIWRPLVGHHVKLFQIRPEIRFDRSLNGTRPFGDFRNGSRVMVGGDMTLGF